MLLFVLHNELVKNNVPQKRVKEKENLKITATLGNASVGKCGVA